MLTPLKEISCGESSKLGENENTTGDSQESGKPILNTAYYRIALTLELCIDSEAPTPR